MHRRGLVCSLLLGVSVSCAGATERSSGDAEVETPSSAASVRTSEEPASQARVQEPPAEDASVTSPAEDAEAPFDSRWADDVRSVVAQYESWGRIDDEARWAPGLCRMPRAGTAHISESDDADTHGQKLYTLYAMDPVAYGARPSERSPKALGGLSQVIVKESFAPVLFDDDTKVGRGPGGGVGTHRLQPAHRDGRRFIAGDHRGLYLMMKTDPSTAGTDEGWVYATVAPDRVTITAMGMIDSCMGCHVEAGDGRLFGLPKSAGAAAPWPHDANRMPSRNNANRVPL